MILMTRNNTSNRLKILQYQQ